MGLELYMIGVIVADMAKSVEFLEGSENQPHVKVKMGELTFFLHDKKLNAKWDKVKVEPAGGYRIVLEFYLKTKEGVDAKYAEMMSYGYTGHFAPYDTPINTYFAMIDDPDGNSILISAG